MKTTTFARIRVSRFLRDRYAYRERPNYFAEFALLAIVMISAFWPMLLLANAMAMLR
jgi:hypothetical protein